MAPKYKPKDQIKIKGRKSVGVIERVRPIEFQPFPGVITYSVYFADRIYERREIAEIVREDEIEQ